MTSNNQAMIKSITTCVLMALAIGLLSCDEALRIDAPGNLVPKTVMEDATLPSIQVNGSHFHAETFGHPDSAMVIFLHGGPGADYRNGLPVKALADDGYFVVFYDQRGSGLSERHDKHSYSVDLMIDDLRAVIDYYKTAPDQQVFLIGHSWGGMMACAFVNQYPSEIAGVVFAEPGGFTSKILFAYGDQTRTPSMTSELLNDVVYLDQFLTGGENSHEVLDYKLNVISSTVFEKGNEEGIEGPSPFWRNGAVMLDALRIIAEEDGFDFTTNLDKYLPTVLFVYGENNKAYGLRGATEEASFFPSSSLAEIPDTGHEMFYFAWDNVHPVILQYLNSLK
jgi:proline iminopeptidase